MTFLHKHQDMPVLFMPGTILGVGNIQANRGDTLLAFRELAC